MVFLTQLHIAPNYKARQLTNGLSQSKVIYKPKTDQNLRPSVFCWSYKDNTTSKKSTVSFCVRNNPCLSADSKVLQRFNTTASESLSGTSSPEMVWRSLVNSLIMGEIEESMDLIDLSGSGDTFSNGSEASAIFVCVLWDQMKKHLFV